MATWPASLGVPLLVGYNARETPRILATQMESGPQRMTLYSAHPRLFGSASVVIDKPALIDFNTMIENSRLGTAWIDDVPIDTGLGLALHRARITSVQYSVIKPPDVYWKIIFTFETDERNAA